MKIALTSLMLTFLFVIQGLHAQQSGMEFKVNMADSFDIELLNIDIEMVKSNFSMKNDIPLSIGAFPVKDYPGSAGATDLDLFVHGKRFTGGSFSIGKSLEAEKHYDFENSHKVFCNIVVLSDFYDLTDYSHRTNFITSRNHPNYLTIGSVKTQKQKIDYVTFIDVKGESLVGYAIVSGKLFDLEEGNTIVVVPQKNYSLRFFQINTDSDDFKNVNNVLTKELSKEYYKKLISNNDTI